MSETATHTIWLTQEAYDRLHAELDHLSGEGRVDIAKKIEMAREEGDLRPSFPEEAFATAMGLEHFREHGRPNGMVLGWPFGDSA